MPKKRSSTKSRIIKAAWNLFYKHGYEQTTVDEIISASKTSKGTFYRRINNPGEFQLGELLRLCKYLGFPIEKTRSLINYR